MELLGCIVSLMLILSNASVILKQVMRDHKGNKARFGARKAISKMVTEDPLHVFLFVCFVFYQFRSILERKPRVSTVV